MLKKLLILPILGSIFGLGAFASADTVDGFTSESEIHSFTLSDTSMYSMEDMIDGGFSLSDFYACVSSDDIPFYWGWIYGNGEDLVFNVNSSVYCSSTLFEYGDYYFEFYSSYEAGVSSTPKSINGILYVSTSPITYGSSSDDSDSSLGIPEIPASFTSGLTSLVNNFGGTIGNWLPTIILVALGIYAIFALFRVVRNYARSSFRG